jgi:predicted phosphodiesterase
MSSDHRHPDRLGQGLPLPGTSQSASPAAPLRPVRLLVLSDLHLEFAGFETPDPATYDIAVLAGDIWSGAKAVRWARRASTFAARPVVLVPGNHEFYGSERTRTLELMREAAADSNVHLLDRDEVTLLGIRFLGATLWTDFALDVPRGVSVEQAMQHARQGLNDFSGLIHERRSDPNESSRFRPEDSAREHALSRAWLESRLAAGTSIGGAGPAIASATTAPTTAASTVVVTHHGPSSRSVAPMYRGSRLNPCFSSELPEGFFGTPALWIHGHTHTSLDYRHHGTRVVTNPRGYVNWKGDVENRVFDPGLVIEVGGGHG